MFLYFRNKNEKEVSLKESDKKQKPEAAMAKTWRDLIPVIKCDVTSVSFVDKNYFLLCNFLNH